MEERISLLWRGATETREAVVDSWSVERRRGRGGMNELRAGERAVDDELSLTPSSPRERSWMSVAVCRGADCTDMRLSCRR